MNSQQQREALENALNSFGLTNLTLYPKISVDKREKKPKFFLRKLSNAAERSLPMHYGITGD